jgi:hypothetical protein
MCPHTRTGFFVFGAEPDQDRFRSDRGNIRIKRKDPNFLIECTTIVIDRCIYTISDPISGIYCTKIYLMRGLHGTYRREEPE